MEKRPVRTAIHDTDAISRFDYPRNKPAYTKKLTILSNISEKNEVDHVMAIDFDRPEFAVTDNDERWILPHGFDIAGHPWYWEQTVERQIEIGKYRLAEIAKVGSQFEKKLIRGVEGFHTRPQNTEEENTYSMHEAREEVGHIRMFEKSVELIKPDVRGAPAWFHTVEPLLKPVARHFPEAFWAAVLAGEEPIDQTQRQFINMAKQGAAVHPMALEVMKLHVEEEARHISFAHLYLERHIDPRRTDLKSRMGHFALSITYPVAMRVFADAILRPSKQAIKDMDIDPKVAREVWFSSKYGQNYLRGLFPDARREADKLQLRRTKIARATWRALGIDEAA